MPSKFSKFTWGWSLVCVCTASLLGVGVWYTIAHGQPTVVEAASAQEPITGERPAVEVMSPRPGGIDRVCLQPGSIEPFEAADLYTKVSGFLVEQNVDIGYPVRQGEVLARIAVPEHEKQVKQDAAEVARALAKVDQMTAAITTAEADFGVASAAIALAQAEKKAKVSFRAFREKQRDRIRDLVARMALEAKNLDEQEDHYQAAIAADLAAAEAVTAAKQKEGAARARIAQAKADRKYAEAEVETAKARLEKSQVLVDYAVIRAPYTGVVTKRDFHLGDFIRSADAGGDRLPVLVVERIDVMRVVVQIPERDVPFVDRGDPASVEVDALPGVVFKTRGTDKVEVSRLAASEDPHTRMMRTEIHVKNPDGKLRRGMFGRVTLSLQVGAPGAFRIPSSALVGKADGGKGSVRVVRDEKAYLVPIRYGADNGSEVEVLSGLTLADRVIVRTNGAVADGVAVTVTDRKQTKAGH